MEKNNAKKTGSKEEAKAEAASREEAKPGSETMTMPRKEYEALTAKCNKVDELEDKYLRTRAEFENARRRMEKDKVDFLKYANDSMIRDFLPILDNLEISEKHIKEAKDFKAVQEGVDMIHGQIQRFLKDIGVDRIKTVGEKFDPYLHEAIETEESPEKEDGLIVGELKPGYKLKDRLLRPALVKIVKRVEKSENA